MKFRAWSCQASQLENGARDDARPKIDLVAVGAMVDGALHGQETGALHRIWLERLAFQRGLDASGAPGLTGDAAERHADVADGRAVRFEVEADRCARGGEFVGLPVADLQIGRMSGCGRSGNADR